MEWGLRFVNQSLGSDEIKKKEKKKRKAALERNKRKSRATLVPKIPSSPRSRQLVFEHFLSRLTSDTRAPRWNINSFHARPINSTERVAACPAITGASAGTEEANQEARNNNAKCATIPKLPVVSWGGESSSSRVESILPLITEVAPSIFDNLSGDYERGAAKRSLNHLWRDQSSRIRPNRFYRSLFVNKRR